MSSQTARGVRSTRPAIRPQTPSDSGLRVPLCGRNGQKATRPNTTSTAGRNVVEASSAAAMPMAATGPRSRFEFSSLNSRHNTPRMTVPAEARIGSMVPRHARSMASRRPGTSRSSSR